MSKRFGRNQRRKLREQLAIYQHAAERAERLELFVQCIFFDNPSNRFKIDDHRLSQLIKLSAVLKKDLHALVGARS